MEVSSKEGKLVAVAFFLGVAAHWAWQRVQWVDYHHPQHGVVVGHGASAPVQTVVGTVIPAPTMAAVQQTPVVPTPVPSTPAVPGSLVATSPGTEVLNPHGQYFLDKRKYNELGQRPPLDLVRVAKNCRMTLQGQKTTYECADLR